MKGIRTAFNGASRIGLLAMVYVLGVLTLSLCIAGRASACPWVEATKEAIVAKQASMINPHQGASQAVLDEITLTYTTAADRINAQVAESLTKLAALPEAEREGSSASFAYQRSASLLAELARIRKAAGLKGRSLVDTAMKQSVTKGVRQASDQLAAYGLKQAAESVMSRFSFTGVDTRLVQTIAGDTVSRLDRSLRFHAENGERVFRDLARGSALSGKDAEVNRAIAQGIVSGDPKLAERAIRELFRGNTESEQAESFRKLGNRMIEVGGWTGTVRRYSSMVANTRTSEALTAARHGEWQEEGFGLVQIEGNETRNFCTRFLHMVFALTPEASEGGKFPLLSSLGRKGPPFHPDCSKHSTLYIPDMVSDRRRALAETARESFDEAKAANELFKPVAA